MRLVWRSLACATLLLAAGRASAQPPRAVVLRFEGWHANETREAVVSALAPEVELIDEARAVSAASELGVDVSTPAGMAAVVRHLRIAIVVAGSIEGRGGSASSKIYVLDADGEELAHRDAPSPRDALAAIGAAALEAVREAIEEIERRNAPPVPAPTPPPEPAPPPPAPPSEPPPGWTPKRVVVLGGVRVRHVGTYVTDAIGDIHFVETTPYPEIHLEVAYRPWSDRLEDALRGVFLSAQGSFSVGMSYVSQPSGEARDFTSLRFALDVGYAYVLVDVLEIAGMIGVGVEGVQLDVPESFVSTLFTFLRPAVLGRLRALGDLLMVEGGLGARIGLDGGPLAAAFGPGFAFGGVDAFVGVAGIVDPGFAWAARFGYLHHALSFSDGGGSLGVGVDGADQAIDVRLLVGWAL